MCVICFESGIEKTPLGLLKVKNMQTNMVEAKCHSCTQLLALIVPYPYPPSNV